MRLFSRFTRRLVRRLTDYITGTRHWSSTCPICRQDITIKSRRKTYLTYCSLCEGVLKIAPDGVAWGYAPPELLSDLREQLRAAMNGRKMQELERKLADSTGRIRLLTEIIKRSGLKEEDEEE